ncbi:MAG: hypothetical protein KF696_05260 [Planctomycetes bacterium]|nr:hypothetical protein [Planctomycetota bacterium]MCW8136294.1 hypothetical protein [Planctomycetota bacterium]
MPLPGHGVGPKVLEDLEGLEIEMVSEQVDLQLKVDENGLQLGVDVTFSFRNHAQQDVTMEVCYPIGPRNNVQGFECETEGEVHTTSIRTEQLNISPKGSFAVNVPIYFYDWTATFPAGQVAMHKVRYTLRLAGAQRTGYTVSTGGPWKGRISKSVITLSGSPEAWAYVRGFGPLGGAAERGGRIVWRYSDYDPTPDHDIWINYTTITLQQQVQSLTKGDIKWAEQCIACNLLAAAHYTTGRLSLDAQQHRDLRQALARLVSQAEEKDGTWSLPATERRLVAPAPE